MFRGGDDGASGRKTSLLLNDQWFGVYRHPGASCHHADGQHFKTFQITSLLWLPFNHIWVASVNYFVPLIAFIWRIHECGGWITYEPWRRRVCMTTILFVLKRFCSASSALVAASLSPCSRRTCANCRNCAAQCQTDSRTCSRMWQ